MQRPLFFIGLLALLWLLPPVAAARSHALVDANTLTLREKASTSAKALATLITYQPVEILATQGKTWTKVATLDGKTGWVLSRYLTRNGFVWVKLDKINVRRGPGTEYAIILNYGKNFPLRVIEIAPNGWLMVMDYEGDRGWIHPNIIQHDNPYVITRLPKCNVRSGPGVDNALKFTAEKGVILKVLDEKEGWLHVRHADGDEGWISANIVFGWKDDVGEGAAMFKDEKGSSGRNDDE